MLQPNPFEGWDESHEADRWQRMEHLGDEIIRRFPGRQGFVEAVMFDTSIDDIAKQAELEDMLHEVNEDLDRMREEIGPVVISPWESTVPTRFDKLSVKKVIREPAKAEIQSPRPYDWQADPQNGYGSFEKRLDNRITKIFTFLGRVARRNPFGKMRIGDI